MENLIKFLDENVEHTACSVAKEEEATKELAEKFQKNFHTILRDDSPFDPEKAGWTKLKHGFWGHPTNDRYRIRKLRGSKIFLINYHDVCTLPRTQSEAEAVLRLISEGRLDA